MNPKIIDSFEYNKIKEVYGTRRAERSGVPLINHINEGLYILHKIGASVQSQKAYCLHPLLQTDEDLAKHFDYVCKLSDPIALALAIEYRSKANAWLSDKVSIDDSGLAPSFVLDGRPDSGPLMGVHHMLIADKIQNYKDFLQYHSSTHPRRLELDVYFKTWLKYLGVDSFNLWREDLERFSSQ